jgi:hypothetical protein
MALFSQMGRNLSLGYFAKISVAGFLKSTPSGELAQDHGSQ